MPLKLLWVCLLLTVTPGAALSLAPTPSSDETWSRLLVGTWDQVVPPGDELLASAWYTFRRDGTIASEAVLKLDANSVRIQVDGRWQIKDGVLIEEVTKTSHPAILPLGTTSKDNILRLDGDRLETRDEEGETERFTRRKA